MSVHALSRAYPSRLERPVLTAVDTRIFSLRYFRHCMDCGFCGDQCCEHGVDVDRDNAERILAMGEEFERFVGKPKTEWFTGEMVADDEFPSRVQTRTRVAGTHCVFHDAKKRGCKIHAWCLEHGLDVRAFKPMVSLLFPVTFEKSVLMPSTEMLDGSLVCGGKGDTLYAGARDELLYFFGDALVRELDKLSPQ
jgi:hypothetical protein